MPLTKKSFVERVMIVLNEDGSFKGAHAEKLSLICVDGALISATQEAAEPLQAADIAALLPTQAALMASLDAANLASATLSEAAQTLATENADLLSTNKALTVGLASAESRADAERTAKETITLNLSIANARIAELEARLYPVDANGFAILSDVQARLALLSAGVTEDSVQAVISAIPDVAQREAARIYWDRAVTVHRDNPLVMTLGAALGFSDVQLNQLWAYAATL